MATLRDIRRRIGSVHNTRKITKAMEMVAAAKLRRNQVRIEALRPYARDMIEMMMDLATYSVESRNYALMKERPVKNVAVIAMTGDRGLAGAFNANVVRRALEIERELRAEGKGVRLIAVGRKGAGTLRFRGIAIDRAWTGLSDKPEISNAQEISRHVIDLFLRGEIDQVRVVYNHFTSVIEQTLVDEVVLPVPCEAVLCSAGERRNTVDFTYEPSATTILEGLLPAYVEIAIYRALLESSASEQGARMSAMRNASDSANEMIDRLTLQLNRARQAAITQEILEVVGGAEGLG